MRIKLDENLGHRCLDILTDAGHDVATVRGQGLAGAADESLIDVCTEEERCLLTLDIDFSNALRFPPRKYAGIAVIRLPAKPDYNDLMAAVRTFVAALQQAGIHRKLWILETGRIRIYQPEGDDD